MWETVKLGNICNVRRGTTITKKQAADGIVPVIGGGTKPTYYHNHPNRDANCITISGSGASAGFANKWDEPIFASDCSTIEPKDGAQLNQFVYYYLLSQQEFIYSSFRSGAAQPHVYAKDIATLDYPLVSTLEQQRIVAILDEAFDGIATATANAEKNLANAKELFESYLNSVFTEKGEGWVEKKLTQISVDFGRGKSKHRPRNDKTLYGGKYPFVQTGDIRNAKHQVTNYQQTYNEKGLQQSKLWPQGTICITIAANIAETAILGFEACFPDSIIGMVADRKLANNTYVEYMLQSFKLSLQAEGKGSAQDNINLATFENIEFPFPDLPTQTRTAEILSQLSSSIETIMDNQQKKRADLTELKQSILQKAFAGELH